VAKALPSGRKVSYPIKYRMCPIAYPHMKLEATKDSPFIGINNLYITSSFSGLKDEY